MPDLLEALFTALVFITVALTALGVGLVLTTGDVLSAARRVSFLVAVAVNVALVPLAGFLLIRVIPLPAPSRSGVVLCVICSGGPLALKASQIARADLGWSLSLTSVLLGLNVITVPVWSGLLLGRSLSVSPGSLVALLGVTIIAPYVIGTTLRALEPSIARVWWPRIAWTSNVTLIVAIVSGLAAHGVDLISTGIPLVLVTALAMVLAAGLLARAAPEDTRTRRATILGGINRATSIGLLVADRAFPDQPEVLIAAIAFGLVQTSVALGLAFYWRSTSPIPVAAELGVTG